MVREDRLRMRIAREAARIMAEEGIDEYGLAKKKAAERMGVADIRNLPRAEEIEAALIEHHRLFDALDQPRRLSRLRQYALEAMRFLEEYSPVLVGGVWTGGAGRFSPIRLYLFPAAPEDVMRRLMNAGIPFEEKFHDHESLLNQPALCFYVNDIRVELLLLPPSWKGRILRKKGGQPAGGGIGDLEKLMGMETPWQRNGKVRNDPA